MQEAASPAVAAEKFQYAKNFAERQKREDLVVAQTIENTYLANRSSFNNPLPTESPAEEERAQSAPTSSGRAQQSSSSFKKSADTAAAPPPLAVAASRPTRFESDDRVAALAMAEPAYAPAVAVAVGAIQAVWSDGELFFARRARVDGTEFIQGAWLDWDELEALLLSRVADLLPDATLEPITTGRATNGAEAARRLAFLPVILETGAVATGNGDGWTPLRVSLATAWGSAAIGAAALALLLAGTLRLSERRGAFVSAVTHELRTPLTTFRMYTEMLAGGMVPDESRRRGYLDTLRKEAERLSHLVENVLSYARLERGRASSRVEDTTPLGLLERVEERLRQRAEQGALELRVEFAGDSGSRALRTDTTAVEQILFNLVDNAAKYARPAEGTAELRLSVAPRANGGVHVRVRDNGPGLPPAARKRLFRPFSKSATEAAHSQPGVGLGLALSRRLARDELHGDLALEETGPGGTTFRLDLPAG
jgi:signal transduction histidine kinase